MNSILICSECSNVFKSKPLSLPCGYIICDSHFQNDSNTIDCATCQEEHEISDCRPCKNIEIEWLKMNLENEINDFRKVLLDLSKIKQDPEFFVSEYFKDLINNVDLRREEVKKMIDDHFLNLIKILNSHEQRLKNNCNNLNNLNKIDIDSINRFFDEFPDKFKLIKSIIEKEKEVEKIKQEFDSLKNSVDACLKEIFENKQYCLTSIKDDIDFEQLFGKILLGESDIQSGGCKNSIQEAKKSDGNLSGKRSSGKTNEELVNNLFGNKVISSSLVRLTMLLVDRGYFAPINPYDDCPQLIGSGVTISAPHMHAIALELLKENLTKNATVLDIGSGSGYLTACFATIIGNEGKIIGIDHNDELVKKSIENVNKWNKNLLKYGNLKFVVGDGRAGYSIDAPYDAIHVGAAMAEIPKTLLEQLAPGGRMVLPLGIPGQQFFTQVDKLKNGEIVKKALMGVNYGSLTDKPKQQK